MQGLTSSDSDEMLSLIRLLSETDAGTCFMHESFHKDNPGKFTREWFSWANTLFAELVIC
jgi:meiotically up-regulated gene 157 (Mug157) protein